MTTNGKRAMDHVGTRVAQDGPALAHGKQCLLRRYTAKGLVDRALDEGPSYIAVTDQNTGSAIVEVKEARSSNVSRSQLAGWTCHGCRTGWQLGVCDHGPGGSTQRADGEEVHPGGTCSPRTLRRDCSPEPTPAAAAPTTGSEPPRIRRPQASVRNHPISTRSPGTGTPA